MKRAVIGLDGFVDEVVHVVDKRTGRDAYTRIETIGEYANRLAQTDAMEFLDGKLEGWPPGECLEFGTASSGFYVRNGRLAEKEELYGFLEEWRRAEHGEI